MAATWACKEVFEEVEKSEFFSFFEKSTKKRRKKAQRFLFRFRSLTHQGASFGGAVLLRAAAADAAAQEGRVRTDEEEEPFDRTISSSSLSGSLFPQSVHLPGPLELLLPASMAAASSGAWIGCCCEAWAVREEEKKSRRASSRGGHRRRGSAIEKALVCRLRSFDSCLHSSSSSFSLLQVRKRRSASPSFSRSLYSARALASRLCALGQSERRRAAAAAAIGSLRCSRRSDERRRATPRRHGVGETFFLLPLLFPRPWSLLLCISLFSFAL